MLVREGVSARLTIALAGHPQPLLIRGNGEVEQLGRSGTVLGVVNPVSIEETEILLSAKETLLLYTDGVIEAGRPGHLLGEDAAACSRRTLAARPSPPRSFPRAHRAGGPHARPGQAP